MPPIPIHSSSPITAAKPSGVTPQTAQAADVPPSKTEPLKPTPVSAYQPYPPAQPGARPSLPAPTGAVSSSTYPEPTPTRRMSDMSPPAPQPGAVPPPPRAGETLQNPPPAQITQMPMPPQMSYAPPTGSVLGPARSSTTTSTHVPRSGPTVLAGDDLSHPPGYQQDVHASEFSSDQRAAHSAFVAQNSSRRISFTGDDDGEGVWDTAKKWAAAAGDSLAAAENEVWKRINKD